LGKGSVQTPRPVPGGAFFMKLTTGTFLRPSGKNMHRFADSKPADDWGVRPDAGLESRVSPTLGKQLKEWWLLQTLRPGPATEILPLDDPCHDPQRQDAVQALKKERS
jgi:carboxyl-terminal processing protease